MPFTDVTQIAQSAIETGLAFMTGDTKVTQVDGLRLLEALRGDLETVLGNGKSSLGEIAQPTDEARELTEVAGSLRDTANRIEEAFHAAFSPADIWEGPYRVKDVFAVHSTLGDAIIVLDKKAGVLQAAGYTDATEAVEFAPRAEWQPVELIYQLKAPLGELHADGVAVEVADATEADLSEVQAVTETGRRAPVVVDFRILKPGPGNKKHKRYYPADVVERDIHVFEGADVYATDHVMKERNEQTKKGKVLQCPAYFTEDKAPIARVLIYDPDQAEKTRNRADAGELGTMECSIFGKGIAKPGTVGGKKYSVVQEMTRGLYLDLVSSGGAGGQAQSLVESDNGGEMMTKQEEKTTPAADTEVVEVDIEESDKGEAEPEAGETPQPLLESKAVETALAETKLPSAFKAALSKGDYADGDALKEAISTAIAEVKKLSGSGQVQDLGETNPPQPEQLTVEELAERADERYENTKRRFGM